MTEKLQCDGFNLIQNNGEAAGQTVMHFHMHLIPRYKGDGQEFLKTSQQADQEELEAVRRQIIE